MHDLLGVVHSVSNAITRLYVEDCREARSPLRFAAHELALPETYAQSYGKLLLDRPLFVPEQEIAGFAEDLARVFSIMVSLPDRLFGGDLRAYCAALGIQDCLAELMCHGPQEPPPLHARADAYHDGDSFKLLELNVGSELGGTDAAQMNRAFLRVPAFAAFAERHELGYVDTTARVAKALRRVAETVTTDEPVIALVESTGGLAAHEHVFAAVREAMLDHGVDLMLGEIHELGERNGKITLRGAPVDVILRYFVASELVGDPDGKHMVDLLTRAHADGRTVLFTPLSGAAFASKGTLALLHDPHVRKAFTAAERVVVDRVVPWTRLLGAHRQEAGDHAELLDRCRADRENLVLKPGIGYSGVGTVVGHEATDEQWQQALRDSGSADHVVQRRVRAVGEPVVNSDTGAVEDWVANWGVFVDLDGYAGGFVRALKAVDGAVVSYSNSGTRGACVFTAPASRKDRAE